MSFADRDGLIWFDGELVPWREAQVHVLTHTLHYGLGVFEGVRAYKTPDRGTCIFKLAEHTDRLYNSAKILSMEIPWEREVLLEAQRTVVRENGLDEAYLRPMCFYGSEGMGLRADNLKTHTIVAAWEWPSYMDPDAARRGIKVRTSSYTRHHVNITMCKAKANGNYINSMLALREALESGAEEALLLDNEGYVAEGSGENIFIVRGGQLHTPELTSCLDGITRATIFAFARELGKDHRAPHYPRRGLHRRRGVLHGNRRGGGADS
jgi:branched-chain amino acid aminotransferase